jgi:hypothetical protein
MRGHDGRLQAHARVSQVGVTIRLGRVRNAVDARKRTVVRIFAIQMHRGAFMRMSVRLSSCLLLLACGARASAQQPQAGFSGQWSPMVEENERLFQQAEAVFDVAVEQAKRKAEEDRRPTHRPSRKELDAAGVPTGVPDSSGGPLTEGGQTQSLGPGAPNFSRGGGKGAERWLTFQELLPASLDFAAPRNGGLILQRTSRSVLFGRTDSDEMVILPLSGEDTDIVHGMRASIHEVDGNLRLMVGLPTGTQVLFEYKQDPDPARPGLSVDIRIGGGPPGTGVELKRLYRRAQVNVGAPSKAQQ